MPVYRLASRNCVEYTANSTGGIRKKKKKNKKSEARNRRKVPRAKEEVKKKYQEAHRVSITASGKAELERSTSVAISGEIRNRSGGWRVRKRARGRKEDLHRGGAAPAMRIARRIGRSRRILEGPPRIGRAGGYSLRQLNPP